MLTSEDTLDVTSGVLILGSIAMYVLGPIWLSGSAATVAGFFLAMAVLVRLSPLLADLAMSAACRRTDTQLPHDDSLSTQMPSGSHLESGHAPPSRVKNHVQPSSRADLPPFRRDVNPARQASGFRHAPHQHRPQ